MAVALPLLGANLRATVPKLEAEVTCSLCQGVLRDAHTISTCDHNFCRVCIEDDLGSTGRCPVCSTPSWLRDLRRNIILQNVANLFVNLRALGWATNTTAAPAESSGLLVSSPISKPVAPPPHVSPAKEKPKADEFAFPGVPMVAAPKRARKKKEPVPTKPEPPRIIPSSVPTSSSPAPPQPHYPMEDSSPPDMPSPAAAPKPGWACSACTFINPPLKRTCEVCSTKKPAPPPAPVAPRRRTISPRQTKGSGTDGTSQDVVAVEIASASPVPAPSPLPPLVPSPATTPLATRPARARRSLPTKILPSTSSDDDSSMDTDAAPTPAPVSAPATVRRHRRSSSLDSNSANDAKQQPEQKKRRLIFDTTEETPVPRPGKRAGSDNDAGAAIATPPQPPRSSKRRPTGAASSPTIAAAATVDPEPPLKPKQPKKAAAASKAAEAEEQQQAGPATPPKEATSANSTTTTNSSSPSSLLKSPQSPRIPIPIVTKDSDVCIVISGLTEDQKRILQTSFPILARNRKARILSDYDPTAVTHVVTSVDDKGQCRRTRKYMLGILNGAWIVDFDWFEQCVAKNAWVAEEPYEIHCDTVFGRGCGPRRARQAAINKEHRLFFHCKVYLYGDFISPPKEELEILVQAGGGRLLTHRPPNKNLQPSNRGGVVDVAKPIIIYDPTIDLKLPQHSHLRGKAQVFDSNWILNCISCYSISEHVTFANDDVDGEEDDEEEEEEEEVPKVPIKKSRKNSGLK